MKEQSMTPPTLSPSPMTGLPPPTQKSPKIAGVIQCKNDWGLIALSIGFALPHHVDGVFVLNDGSNDETHLGLKHLQEIWPGRIHVSNQSEGRFFQLAQIDTDYRGKAKYDVTDWASLG
ncbi:MAG: hypothetical protein H6Q00_3351 [Holophagaceae bacterium]|nr:hypothetical protein [Holophagaceae bacterium]